MQLISSNGLPFLRIGVLFLLFGLPFVVLPFGTSYFEIPKVIVAQIAIELLVGIFLYKGMYAGREFKNHPALLLYVGIFLLSLLHLLFFRTEISFFGNQFRYQGIFLLWHLLLFSLISPIVSAKDISQKIIFLFLLAEVFFALVLQTNAVGRSIGTLGEPNALAAAGVFVLPFDLFRKSQARYMLGIQILLVVLVIFLSGSRSGFLAVMLQLGFFIMLHAKKVSFMKATAATLVFYAAFLILPFLSSQLHESRAEIWKAAIIAGSSHPFLGGGFGNTEKLLHDASNTFASFISARYVDSSHNIFLDFFVQGGIFGVSFLVLLIGLSFKHFVKTEKKLELAILVGIITVLSYNPGSVWTLLVFWWIVGQGMNMNTMNDER